MWLEYDYYQYTNSSIIRMICLLDILSKNTAKLSFWTLLQRNTIVWSLYKYLCIDDFLVHRVTIASMASDKSDESEVEDTVNEDEIDLGFPGTDLILVVEGRKIHVNKMSSLSTHLYLIPCFTVNSRKVLQKRLYYKTRKQRMLSNFLNVSIPTWNIR